jgi:primosomal protein N' (replication factor Y)
MTSDTVTSAATADALVDAMLERRIDILIGTQLIAKGHHFPELTLAGVVDADFGLAGGDPRAAERTFQLLYQLAGRAGREQKPGLVLIQTHLPDHPVMQALALGDREAFMAAEEGERRDSGMPPFGRLAALILSGPDSATVKVESRKLVRAAPEHVGWHILGPAPAPLALLRGRYRERILIKAPADPEMPDKIADWVASVKLPGAVRLQVDIDPQSFF